MTGNGKEPLAIVGIGCRLPGGANNPATFWKNLVEGKDAIRQVPEDRWNVERYYDPNPKIPGKMITRWGGFIDDVDQFDARFFGISPREALRMDPQQRWLLEVAWEAIEDGGHAPEQLSGSRTGVFVGIASNDYANIQMKSPSDVDVHTNSGSTLSIASNRISYLFNFKGPSISVDTACSSALVAVNLACRGLWDGQCDTALAGGVNALLTPDSSIGFSKASMLSPDGRCFAFDARANGYVRGEGAGMLLIKPLSRALAEKDPIYAVIRAAVINQDGRTNAMTVPGLESQSEMLDDAYQQAGISPSKVCYMEAHGTGTPVGDPIEVQALGNVLGRDRKEGEYCVIGSVKANIGHLESASGVAGLIKAALVLKHRIIPPNLNFKTPNPNIPFEELRLRVPVEAEPLPEEDTPAVAAVNSFGFGGTNAHIVLSEPPKEAIGYLGGPKPKRSRKKPVLLPLSGNTENSLKQAADDMAAFLTEGPIAQRPALRDVLQTAALRKDHHEHRLAVVGSSAEEISERIKAWSAGEKSIPGIEVGRASPDKPEVVFVFTGQGPQWWGMGQELIKSEPVFRQTLEKIDGLMKKLGGWSLLEEMSKPEAESNINRTDIAQPAIFALQVGLAEVWRSRGIEPSLVIGHSVGEVAAAYWAGIYNLEDAVKVIFHRSRLQNTTGGHGRMVAVGLSREKAEEAIRGFEEQVSVAVINSPSLVTLAGDTEALESIIEPLEKDRTFIRWLRIDYAFHTHQMDPIKDELLESIEDIEPHPGNLPFISTVTGELLEGTALTADYWWQNVRHSVLFSPAICDLIDQGNNLFLELGPHPALASSIQECLAQAGASGGVLPSLRRKEAERERMLQTLGTLHTIGASVDWEALYGKEGQYVRLPTYPWQHERYWLESEESYDYRMAQASHPLLGLRARDPSPTWKCVLYPEAYPYLDDHRLRDSMVYPASAYVETALAAGKEVFADAPYSAEDIKFQKAMFFAGTNALNLQFSYDEKESAFEIFSCEEGSAPQNWELNAIGRLQKLSLHDAEKIDLGGIRSRLGEKFGHEEIYSDMVKAGYQFGPCFSLIQNIWRIPGESLGEIEIPDTILEHSDAYLFHPAVLDACFQCVSRAQELLDDREIDDNLYLPIGLDRIRLFRKPEQRLWSHAQILFDDGEDLAADIQVYDQKGRQVAEIKGFRCQHVEQSETKADNDLDRCLYEFRWEPSRLSGSALRQGGHALEGPQSICETIKPEIEPLYERYKIKEHLHDFIPALEKLSFYQIMKGLGQLGWKPRKGEVITVEGLMKSLGIIETHNRLMHSFFQALSEEKTLLPLKNGKWEIGNVPNLPDTVKFADALTEQYPDFYAQIPLLKKCGAGLAEVLSGRLDPLQLIFSPESAALLDNFYKNDADFLSYNELLQKSVSAAIANLPENSAIRILEIGAGTGSLTEKILPILPAAKTKYTFTDITPVFPAQAKQNFSDYDFVDFAVLDIEKDPATQGIEPHSFDIVLATNVLHATVDLRRTLHNVRRCLSSGGILIFLEVTKPLRSLDQVFGLMKGWWHYEDTDLRPDCALLPRRKWTELLSDSGFSQVSSVINSVEDDAQQTVFLAQVPEISAERAEEISTNRLSGKEAPWLIFADSSGVGESVADKLEKGGNPCTLVYPSDSFSAQDDGKFSIRASETEDMRRLLTEMDAASKGLGGIVHLWSLDHPSSADTTAQSLYKAQETGCINVMNLVQALSPQEFSDKPRVWLITNGAQSMGKEEELTSIASTPMFGLARVANNEHQDFSWTGIDLDPSLPKEHAKIVFHEICSDDRELEVIHRIGVRYGNRLHNPSPDDLPEQQKEAIGKGEILPYRLEIPTPGVLSNLCLRETQRKAPEPGEIEIEVAAVGMNFRDVMKALGMYPGKSEDLRWLGDECSGKVVAIGEGVDRFKVGDEVVGMAPYCCRAYTTVNQALVFKKPSQLSFEEAATLPVVFLTSHYALNHLARLQPGEKVLIHAGAGGVGQAAIQIAQQVGAEVFATAGSDEKRDFLRSQGVEHVMDSRSLDFADEILELTDGRGVDIVLNQLAGDFIQRSFSVLAPYGRFLEIGKIDIYSNTKIGLEPFKDNISYFAIDLACFLKDKPAFITSMLAELAALFEEKKLRPLPLKSFPVTEAEAAFRYMAQARHIGKNVLSLREDSIPVGPSLKTDTLFRTDATYLITGGLGGFCLEVARWMVDYGARNLVLMGRSGASTDLARETIALLEEKGARVVAAKADVTKEEDIARVLKLVKKDMPPLRGIIHGAMVLDDDWITQLNEERFYKVLDPKMTGAWNLHSLTLNLPLDHFILFSSASSLIGGAGQGNYASANYFLDAMAHYRKSLGLPALTMNWGALSEAGYVARNEKVAKYLDQLGLESFTPKEALSIFAKILNKNTVQLGASRVNWSGLARLNPATASSPTYSVVVNREKKAVSTSGDSHSFRPKVIAAAPGDRLPLVADYICEQVAQVFGTTAAKIDRDTPLTQIGLDSLMAIELMNRLESNLGISLPMGQFLQGPNINELAIPVLDLLLQSSGGEGGLDSADSDMVGLPSVEISGEEQTVFPLSEGQRALWFLNRLAPKSPAYNLIFSSKITPYVDIPVMEKAFAALFKRHPMLDVTFSDETGHPVQTLRKSRTIDFREHDTSHLNDEEIKELLVDHANQPFDLKNGPVVRLELFRTTAGSHITLLSMHHIVSDAWSVVLVMRDLMESYFSIKSGGKPKFQRLRHRYSDYVNWQQSLLKGPHQEKMLTFWKDHLRGAPTVLDLPTDHPRPPVQTFNGSTHGFKLDDLLSGKVDTLAKENKVTLYSTLLSAFQVLLHRYCNQDDLIVGSPFAGRSIKEFHDLVGYFINPVPLRSRIEDDPTFKDYLQQVSGSVIGALENQEFPVSHLVDQLKVKRDPSRSPVFQVTFSMERIPGVDEQGIAVFLIGQGGHDFKVGDISVESIDLNLRQAQFEISLVVEEAGGHIYGCWQYNRDLFEPGTIDRLNGLFKQILEEVVVHPEKKISELSFLSRDEEKKILEDWNHTDLEYPEDKCLHQLVTEHALRNPNRTAVTCAGRSLTYSELNRRANGLALKLRSAGINVDCPVGLYVDRSVEMLVAALGILKAGGCYVPLDPLFPVQRLQQMLDDANPSIVVTQNQLRGSLPKGPWKTMMVNGGTAKRGPVVSNSPESLAYIIYTSGSTGKPKGVEVPHRAVVNFLSSMRETPGLISDDTLLAVTTLSFDISVLELFLPLVTEAQVVIATREEATDGRRLSMLLEEYAVTTMQATPATWQMLVDSGWNGKHDLRVFCGGEALSRELAESLLPSTRAVWNLYGPTETTIWSTVDKVESQSGCVPIGRPIANTTIYILDDNHKALPPGFTGHLYIGGDGLARGYHNQPDVTAEKFIKLQLPNGKTERVYQTGDLARFLPDGKVDFLGRSDTQVKLRGYRLELEEIETHLCAHHQVDQAVVVKRSDMPGGENLVGYIICSGSTEGLTTDLRNFLLERLPDYMRPAAYVLLEEYPLTPNKKIDRLALPIPQLVRAELEAKYTAPQTPTEKILVDILNKAFSTEEVGIQDNFFELGGDSLLALQILTEISQVFNRQFPVEVFLRNPTVEHLALFLDTIPDERETAAGPGFNSNGYFTEGMADEIADSDYLTLEVVDGTDGERDKLPKVDAVALAYIPDAFLPLTGLTKDDIARNWLHGKSFVSNLYETPYGRIGLVMLPRLGSELYKNQELLGDQIMQSLEVAKSMGAKQVSLTGLIPSATNYGLQVTELINGRTDLPDITTGHATTTASIIKNMEGLLKLANRNLEEESVAIVGLGSIGYSTMRLMLEVLPYPKELILCDLYQKLDSLEDIRRKLVEELGFDGKIRLEPTRGQLPDAVYNASFVLGATNVPGILDVNRLSPGTLIVDDSFPPCFRTLDAVQRIETRHDILFTTGGLIRLQEEVNETIYLPGGAADRIEELGGNRLLALVGRDPREMTGCILSSLLTGRKPEIRPTLGPVTLADSLAHYKLLHSLDLESARPQCESYFISPESVERFKKATGSETSRTDTVQGV